MASISTNKPLSFFHGDPNQPRKSFPNEELWQLHDSLVQKQLVPLLALPDGTILDGERRWRAAMLDGKPEMLDVIISEKPLTPADIKEIQLVTALHRADLKPYEQYCGFRDWLALNPGSTAKDLAAKINRDASTLTVILSLGKCVQEVQEAAAAEKIGPAAWYAISQVPALEQPAMLAEALAGATVVQLKAKAKKVPNGNVPGPKVSKLKIPLGQGRAVTFTGSNLDLAAVNQILSDLQRIARKCQNANGNLGGRTWVQVMVDRAQALEPSGPRFEERSAS